MTRSRPAFWLVAVLFPLMSLVAAPASGSPTPAPSPCQPRGDETTEGADLWAEVAEKVPTFAGLYVDEETRTLHVLLTDHGQSLKSAVHALQTIVRSQVLCDFTPVAQQAKYTYSQLKAWDDRLIQVLSVPGTVSSGIDEAGNRLEVGVEDLATHGPIVEVRLVELGIPREVVSIVQQEPVELLPATRSTARLFAVAIGLVVAVGLPAALFIRRWLRRSREHRKVIPLAPHDR